MQQAAMPRHVSTVRGQRRWGLGIVMLLLLVILMALSSVADAKRIGGGSFGRQSSGATQRNANPPAQRNAQKQNNANPQQAGQQPRKPWGGMLGGLAAGLGLAALFHMLGFGPLMGEILGTLMLVFLAVIAISFVLRLLRKASEPQTAGTSMGAGAGGQRNVFEPLNPTASSRSPFQGLAADASAGAAAGGASWGCMEIPEGLDVAQFEDVAKVNFVRLQKAWDANDLASLRAFLSDEMYAIMERRLQDELRHHSQASEPTEIVVLNAHLLGIQDLGSELMASIEFSGTLRERPDAGAESFVEVWNLTKDKNASNSGWLLAGIQQVSR